MLKKMECIYIYNKNTIKKMEQIPRIIIDNVEYISGDELMKHAPLFYKSSKNSREVLRKHNIPEKSFIYAKYDTKKNWIKTNGKSIRFDKVLFSEDYCRTIKELNGQKVDDKGVEEAPNEIKLSDDEKFKDDNNNIIEIYTIGVRTYDKIFFQCCDVSIRFDIKNLNNSIIDEKSSYEKEKDYKYFNVKIKANCLKNENGPIKIKKELFLTYTGLLRVLFCTRNNKTSNFIKWATETLFIHQFGTHEQKQELSSALLGISANVIKEVFNKEANVLPCIYFVTLNTVKMLREEMKIDEKHKDNDMVCKFGCAENFGRRIGELQTKFKDMKNCDLKCKTYSYIDPMHKFDAENDIRNLMNMMKTRIEYKTENELVIVSNIEFEFIKSNFEMVGKKYMGKISELIKTINDLKHERDMLQMTIDTDRMKIYNEFNEKEQKYRQTIHEKEMLNEKCQRETLNEKCQKEMINEKCQREMINERCQNDIMREKHEKEIIEHKFKIQLMEKDNIIQKMETEILKKELIIMKNTLK